MRRSVFPLFVLLSAYLISPGLAATGADPATAAWYPLDRSGPGSEATLASVDELQDGLRLRVRVPGLEVWTAATDAGPRGVLDIPGGSVTGDPGTPRLPVLRYLVETPPGAEVRIDWVGADPRVLKFEELGIDAARLLPGRAAEQGDPGRPHT